MGFFIEAGKEVWDSSAAPIIGVLVTIAIMGIASMFPYFHDNGWHAFWLFVGLVIIPVVIGFSIAAWNEAFGKRKES